jgi:hypothetical protein
MVQDARSFGIHIQFVRRAFQQFCSCFSFTKLSICCTLHALKMLRDAAAARRAEHLFCCFVFRRTAVTHRAHKAISRR